MSQLDVLYVSTHELYQNWLLGASVSPEYKAVYDGQSHPDYNEDMAVDDVGENMINNVTKGLSLLVIR